MSSINFAKNVAVAAHFNGGDASTAEATTLQLEFKYLTYLTDDPKYWNAVQNTMKQVFALPRPSGLVPVFLNPMSGHFSGQEIRLGSRGDSYYEYLAKQWMLTRFTEDIYENEWRTSVAGIRQHLLGISSPNNYLFVGERPSGIESQFSTKMDHLVCFLPGTLALAATQGKTITSESRLKMHPRDQQDLELAEELAHSCYQMYRQTNIGLAGEIVFWNQGNAHAPAGPHRRSFDLNDSTIFANESVQKHKIARRLPAPISSKLAYHQTVRLAPGKPQLDPIKIPLDFPGTPEQDFSIHEYDAHNLLRPETIESLFYLYRITHDPIYRTYASNMFDAFETHTRVEHGYSSLNSVKKEKDYRDKMETFFLGETLKYFYLIFVDDLPLDQYVFNTEAHPFPIFDLSEELKAKLTFLT